MIDFIHYEMRFGDTILSVAKKFNIDENFILYYNHFKSIYPGIVIKIPKQKNALTCKNPISRNLEFYLKRHLKKKHLFNFYNFKKSH